MAQELKSNLQLNINATLQYYLGTQTHGYRWPRLLLRMAFCQLVQPCQTMKVHYRVCGASENGINKDMCDAKLLPTTVSTYPVVCVCFCHLLETEHCCLCSIRRHNLPSAAHLSPTTTPPPPTRPPPYTCHP